MTQIEQDEQDDKPLDPAMEKVRRKMIRLQIVSGLVMFISLMAVFGAVVYKAMGPSKTATATASQSMQVPSDQPIAATASLPQGFTMSKAGWFSNVAWDPTTDTFYASQMGKAAYKLEAAKK